MVQFTERDKDGVETIMMLKNVRIKETILQFCEWFELVLALLVVLGLLLSFINTFTNPKIYDGVLDGTISFLAFLEMIFGMIVGIEFLQMFCKPNSDNVIEVLIFLVARHLILQNTNSTQDFLAVIAVCILCIVRRCLHLNKLKYKDSNNNE